MDIDYLKTTLYERFHEEESNITMVPLIKESEQE